MKKLLILILFGLINVSYAANYTIDIPNNEDVLCMNRGNNQVQCCYGVATYPFIVWNADQPTGFRPGVTYNPRNTTTTINSLIAANK
jgi:hypothetical protein